MIRLLLVAGAVALGLLGPAACQGRASAQPVNGGALAEKTMQHDGRERRYLVHDFSGGKPAPVVFVLHGGGGHPENAQNMSQFDIIGAREKLIVVYAGGTGGMPGGRLLTWNAGHCCAYARENQIDDVGFFRKMIDDLIASGRADPKRIYVTGMSNGAMMSHRLARELPDRIAAIGPIVGAIFGDEPPATSPVAAIVFVGQEDHTVPAAGGPLGGPERRGMAANLARRPEDHNVAPALAQAEYWAKANGCSAPVQAAEQGLYNQMLWDKCASGRPVHYYSVAANGHAWPGGKAGRAEADQPTPNVNASEIMWRFFAANPKP
jgi:polyhydroxybutyrate depolymerase